MPWAGGNYTKWNGAGGWNADAAANIGIESGRHDTQDTDFQDGINQCLNKDGSNAATGDLDIGGNKLTNVAVGTASSDVVTLGQAQGGINIQSTSVDYSLTQFSADTNGSLLKLRKSRGAAVGINTIVNNGDYLGAVQFYGANGTGYDPAADIICFIDDTPGASGDMPGKLVFRTTPNGSATLQDRVTILNSGFVGIGDSSPGTPLDVLRDANDTSSRIRIQNPNAGSSASSGFLLGNNSSSNSVFIQLNSSANTSNGGASSLNIFNGFTAPIRMRAGGSGGVDLTSTATSWAAVSDERFKKNIQPLSYGLAEITALNPIRFDYTEDASDSSARIGFTAQNVEPLVPEAVSGSLETQLTLSATELIPALVGAIKELSVKVETLEARIAALEA